MKDILKETLKNLPVAMEELSKAQYKVDELLSAFEALMELYARDSTVELTTKYFEYTSNISYEITKEESDEHPMTIRVDNVPLRKLPKCHIQKTWFTMEEDKINEKTAFITENCITIEQKATHYLDHHTGSIVSSIYTLSCGDFESEPIWDTII